MEEKEVRSIFPYGTSWGYVKNGVLMTNAPIEFIMVADETERDSLTQAKPLTIAFTAGFGKAWQKAADGTWGEFE